jgi:protein SCO1/2
MNETPPPARGLRLLLTVLAALAVVGGAVYVSGLPTRLLARSAPHVFHGHDITPEHWETDFALTDVDGKARTLAQFRGHVVLLAFGYTHCPDVCPTTLAKFAQARHLLGTEGAQVQGIFVTIDPERDTAELLRAYVPAFDPSFVALRGTDAQTDAVTKAFHANYQIVQYKGDTLVDHTASTYIVDAQGRARVVTPYDQTAADLADDLRAILSSG